MHELPELVPIRSGGLAEKALEARTAVMARRVLRQQLAGMLDEPEHRRAIRSRLPLDPRLKRQHQGADQP
eukprot:15439753-Alexandrium_andersonii.AAC.1